MCRVNPYDAVSRRFSIDQAMYSGMLPEIGGVDVEVFRNLPFDNRVRFHDLRNALNSRSTLSLIRIARHYLPVHPRLQRASVIQVDSYGVPYGPKTSSKHGSCGWTSKSALIRRPGWNCTWAKCLLQGMTDAGAQQRAWEICNLSSTSTGNTCKHFREQRLSGTKSRTRSLQLTHE